MAWLLVLGTIPVGIVGLLFEHNLRTVFAKPTAAAIFLTINGLILLGGERLIYDAVELAAKVPARYGEPLRDVLGSDPTLDSLSDKLDLARYGSPK